jgi:hypothetical protein
MVTYVAINTMAFVTPAVHPVMVQENQTVSIE